MIIIIKSRDTYLHLKVSKIKKFHEEKKERLLIDEECIYADTHSVRHNIYKATNTIWQKLKSQLKYTVAPAQTVAKKPLLL